MHVPLLLHPIYPIYTRTCASYEQYFGTNLFERIMAVTAEAHTRKKMLLKTKNYYTH
jgi:hypothetical protein